MNNKYVKNFIALGMILMVFAVHGSDESGWTPWQSPDFYGDVVAGQTQLKLETERKRLEAEEKQEFAERGLMHVEENSERNRLRQVDQLEQQALLQAQQKALQAKEQARLQAEEKKRDVEKRMKKSKEKAAALEVQVAALKLQVAALEERDFLEKAMIESKMISGKIVDKKRNELLQDSFNDEQQLDCLVRSLKKMLVPEEEIQRILLGHKVAFKLENEFESRSLPSGLFYIDNKIWPLFFDGCSEIINSNAVEVLHHIPSDVLQKDIKEFLDDRNYNTMTNFYKTILDSSVQVVAAVRTRLAIICEDEKKIIENLIRDKSPMAQLAMANLKKFKEMLKFIDDNKKA